LFSSEVVNRLHNEGHPIYPGSVGENILVQGIPWDVISIGTQFHFNQVILEITSDAPPCRTIKDSFLNEEFKCISAKIYPHSTRWYAKVIQSGEVVTGENVILN
jgi:MOSC domain-containing protein YiiM